MHARPTILHSRFFITTPLLSSSPPLTNLPPAGLCWHSAGHISCCPPDTPDLITTEQVLLILLLILLLLLFILLFLLLAPDQEVGEELKEEYAVMRAYAFPTLRQKAILASTWVTALMFGLVACFPDRWAMVWYGTVWYGMVRYGTVQYGMERYGTWLISSKGVKEEREHRRSTIGGVHCTLCSAVTTPGRVWW